MIVSRATFAAGFAIFFLATPLVPDAQPARTVPQVAMLLSGSPSAGELKTKAFRRGLRDLGYVEGQTIAVSAAWAERQERLPELAIDIVRNNALL